MFVTVALDMYIRDGNTILDCMVACVLERSAICVHHCYDDGCKHREIHADAGANEDIIYRFGSMKSLKKTFVDDVELFRLMDLDLAP